MLIRTFIVCLYAQRNTDGHLLFIFTFFNVLFTINNYEFETVLLNLNIIVVKTINARTMLFGNTTVDINGVIFKWYVTNLVKLSSRVEDRFSFVCSNINLGRGSWSD